MTKPTKPDAVLDRVIEAVEEKDAEAISGEVAALQPGETAHLLESLPEEQRLSVWHEIAEESRGEVLADLHDVALTSLAGSIETEDLIAAAVTLETPDLAEVIESLSDDMSEAIRESLAGEQRTQLEATLAYPENSVGRLMNIDVITIPSDVTVDVVLRYLRRRGSLPEHTSGLMVVDRDGHFLGELPITTLLTQRLDTPIDQILNCDVARILVTSSQGDAARLFEDHDLVSVAVVDDAGKLQGRIIVDQMVDVIREEADHQVMNAVGLNEEEDLFAPIIPSARRRALWLGVNLATAFLASWVIGLFEATLEKIVALAVLMPIVASMGGIAGSQTLTLAIRGLALGQITAANRRWLAYKEIAISIINGILWAGVVSAVAYLWFKDIRISGVLAAAMIANLLAAAGSGIFIPLILQRIEIDPALSGSVILTTVTDVIGFMSFLGLATIFLL